MFSIIVATSDSERTLVPTLAALVPGATAGVVREVIVTDAGSRDDTAQVADIAGCRFVSSSQPLGARLKSAAAAARGLWLMFLTPGVVPQPSWIDETIAFAEDSVQRGEARAAVFAAPRTRAADLLAPLRRLIGAPPRPEQGLMLPKTLYDEIGGHRAGVRDPETDLARRLGRRRIVTLHTAVSIALPPVFDFSK